MSPAPSSPLSPAWEGTAGGDACCVALQRPSPGWGAAQGCPCSVCCSCESWFGLQELEAIKAKVREMEKEDERLKELQLEAENRLIMSSEAGMGCPWVLLLLSAAPRDTSGAQGGDQSQSTLRCLSLLAA